MAKLRNFKSLRHKKDQNYPIFYLCSYCRFDVAKGGASVPLAPSLVSPLVMCIVKIIRFTILASNDQAFSKKQ